MVFTCDIIYHKKEEVFMNQKHFTLVLSSFLMMLLMGTVYTYSVFRFHIEQLFSISTLQSGLPYMTSLFFFAFSMMISGRFLTNNRVKHFAVIGTILIILGYILSAFSPNVWVLMGSYGLLIGSGVGMVYGVPIYMVQTLFPQKSGFMTGVVLLGFGSSPLVTAPLSDYLISAFGLTNTFLILASIFLIVQLPLALIFSIKEQPFKQTPKTVYVSEKLKPFKRIYGLFLIATTVGLMMIGLSYQIGVRNYGFTSDSITLFISLFALLNGVARPIFGKLMDLYGFKFTSYLSLFLVIIASLIGLLNQGQHLILFAISFGLFWFNLGAWLAIIPQTIKEYYGLKQYARNYGLVYTAYGVGAILGTLISGLIIDVLNSTSYIYLLILLCMIISITILYYMPSKPRNHVNQ